MRPNGRESLVADFSFRVENPGQESAFVLIAGERGVGKTFIGQELYRHLAATQPSPRFWPSDLLPSTTPRLELDRHMTRPPALVIPADAKPAYAWIGINCQRSVDGVAFNALGAASIQITRLRTAIELALHSGHAGRSRVALMDLLEIVVTFAALLQDPTAAALGAAMTVRPAASLVHSFSETKIERHDLRARDGRGKDLEIDVAASHRATVDAYSELLSSLAGRLAIPVVLLVDDFHHADASLLDLLAGLPTTTRKNLLVLCTAERGVFDDQAAHAQEEPNRAGAWLTPERLPGLRRVDLESMEDSVLTSIVLSHAPRTPRPVVTALVRRCAGNPYRLRLLLDSPRAQPQNDTIVLDVQEVASFPNRIEQIYRYNWIFLSPAAKVVVAVAAMHGRAVVTSALRVVCTALLTEGFATHLAEAQQQQWLVPVSDDVLAFPDDARQAVAREEAASNDVLSLDDRQRSGMQSLAVTLEALRAGPAGWLHENVRIGSEDSIRLLAHLEAAVMLGSQYSNNAPEDVARFAKAFGDYLISGGEFALAAEYVGRVGERLRKHEPTCAVQGVRMELEAAEWLSDYGYLQKAIDRIELLEHDCPHPLMAEGDLNHRLIFIKGRTFSRQGRPDLADPLLERLARDSAGDGEFSERGARVSIHAALSSGATGVGAGRHLRHAVTDMGQVDGVPWWEDSAHCEGLRSAIYDYRLRRVNAARAALSGPRGDFTGYLGDKANVLGGFSFWLICLTMYQDVVSGLLAVKPYDENTLAARSHRAMMLSKLGRLDDALREQNDVVRAYEEFLPGLPPNLLVSRGNRAQTLSRLGEHEKAIGEFEAIYDEQVRLIGQRSPAALDTRMGLARVLARAGKRDEALKVYREATEESLAEFGPSHASTREYLVGLQAFEAGAGVDLLGGDQRLSWTVTLDRRRATGYRKKQSEDWMLLFGTASRKLQLKRRGLEGVASYVGRVLYPRA